MSHYESTQDAELALSRRLALCDLSTLERCGFKGREAPEWLKHKGVQLPDAPNLALHDKKTGIVARLSHEEHLLLRHPFSEQPVADVFGAAIEPGRRVYALPRQDSHAWLFLCGASAAEMMSYICAVDLSAGHFANFNVAQTSVAKLNGIVIRHDLNEVPGFHLLCDQPSVAYWWEVLLDAMGAFDGGPVGIDALLAV